MSETARHRREGRADAFVALTLDRTLPGVSADRLAELLEVTRSDVDDAVARFRHLRGPSKRKPGPNPPGQSWCPDCRQWRSVDAFSRNNHNRDGCDTVCRVCHNERRVAAKSQINTPKPRSCLPDGVEQVVIEEADRDGLTAAELLSGRTHAAVTARRRTLARLHDEQDRTGDDLADWFGLTPRSVWRAIAEHSAA